MPGISPKTRFDRAKKMSLKKWNACAEITEEEFGLYTVDKLGLSAYKCGFCEYYFAYDRTYHAHTCGKCPVQDSQNSCCDEFSSAIRAWHSNDFPAYHAAAVALRDRIKGMEYEEEENVKI